MRGTASRTQAHGEFSASNQKGAGKNNVGVAHRQVEARLTFPLGTTGGSMVRSLAMVNLVL
jgi:hypothetical protein